MVAAAEEGEAEAEEGGDETVNYPVGGTLGVVGVSQLRIST